MKMPKNLTFMYFLTFCMSFALFYNLR
jgi:hypothetical protein